MIDVLLAYVLLIGGLVGVAGMVGSVAWIALFAEEQPQ